MHGIRHVHGVGLLPAGRDTDVGFTAPSYVKMEQRDGMDFEVQMRRRRERVAGVADEADHLARLHVLAAGRARVAGEVGVVELVPLPSRTQRRQPPRRCQPTRFSVPSRPRRRACRVARRCRRRDASRRRRRCAGRRTCRRTTLPTTGRRRRGPGAAASPSTRHAPSASASPSASSSAASACLVRPRHVLRPPSPGFVKRAHVDVSSRGAPSGARAPRRASSPAASLRRAPEPGAEAPRGRAAKATATTVPTAQARHRGGIEVRAERRGRDQLI